jgi:hypothetical protein
VADLIGTIDMRDDNAVCTGIEHFFEPGLIATRHTDYTGAYIPHSMQDSLNIPDIEGGVLHIHKKPVKSQLRENLCELGRGKGHERADEKIPMLKPL